MSLTINEDHRGTFAEVYKDKKAQVSFITINPGKVRGNHYHLKRNEEFIVVAGEAVMNLRKRDTGVKQSIRLLGHAPQKVKVLPNTVHNIHNPGVDTTVVLLVSDLPYDENSPDTFAEDV